MTLKHIAACVLALVSSMAGAQPYPNRPVKVIVPFATGAASDIIARQVFDRVGAAVGQGFAVENRPGAGGTVGSEFGAKAAPDGYTLLISTAALPISAGVYKNLRYDSGAFASVTVLTHSALGLAANLNFPPKTIGEFITYAKANPGKVNFGSAGSGTITHLGGELLKVEAGINLIHVPYKGAAPAVNDMLGGQVQMGIFDVPVVLSHIKAGKLKALAITSAKRAPSLPDVPTTGEMGYPKVISDNWYGLVGPAGIPQGIAKRIHAAWLHRHAGTDRITGSRTADTRAALVEHFRDSAKIMIATEAGAEGINLQFCSLVINYDLPWNPQRIEQRIGRCHRYGQKHDVVVVNFIDLSNPADQRVYELLAQKFQLFEGVFGASDEVLGTIGSGVDFERRIAEIYQTCRTPPDIEASFQQLQLDLSGEINAAMLKTRQLLLENFDEAVQDKLKLRQTESTSARSRYERLLMDLTEAELQGHAEFDDAGFTLHQTPSGVDAAQAPPGRYELPRRSGEAHLYRTGHPLAQALIAQARQRSLPPARMRLSYDGYGAKVSTLQTLRGSSGWLGLSVLTIEAMGTTEDHLLLVATNDAGQAVHDEDAEKLLRLPAEQLSEAPAGANPPAGLQQGLQARQEQRVREVNQRNLGYFEAEVQKLDAWADDLKGGLENDVKALDREIKDVRRTASVAATLEEKLHWQKRQRELEDKRNQLRRRIFDRQDEIDDQRRELIDKLEGRLSRQERVTPVFSLQWELA